MGAVWTDDGLRYVAEYKDGEWELLWNENPNSSYSKKGLKNAEKIYIPNKNGIKVKVLNEVLNEYGLQEAKILQIDTNTADTSRIPALAKAYIALDQSDADLIISRGRLGIPGSGSLLVFIDNKGRILTAGTSASHAVHKKSIEEAVYKEACEALEKIGFEKIEG